LDLIVVNGDVTLNPDKRARSPATPLRILYTGERQTGNNAARGLQWLAVSTDWDCNISTATLRITAVGCVLLYCQIIFAGCANYGQ
jgi:hypothetical protein